MPGKKLAMACRRLAVMKSQNTPFRANDKSSEVAAVACAGGMRGLAYRNEGRASTRNIAAYA